MQSDTTTTKRIAAIVAVPIWTAGISFVLGTILLLLHMSDGRGQWLFVGFFYVITAFVVNLAILLAMVVCSFIYKDYQNLILRNTSSLLLNIPVAVLYFYLAIDYIE